MTPARSVGHRWRSLVGVLALSVPAAGLLGYQALDGVQQARTLGTGGFRASTLAAYAWVHCLEERLALVVPAGARFHIQAPTDEALGQVRRDETVQRLTELGFPRLTQVHDPRRADFVVIITASDRPEACDGVLVASEPAARNA